MNSRPFGLVEFRWPDTARIVSCYMRIRLLNSYFSSLCDPPTLSALGAGRIEEGNYRCMHWNAGSATVQVYSRNSTAVTSGIVCVRVQASAAPVYSSHGVASATGPGSKNVLVVVLMLIIMLL